MQVCYPKEPKKALYKNLLTQCRSLKLPILDAGSLPTSKLSDSCDVVLDAMFGFSFHGAPRAPFDKMLELVAQHSSGCVVVAVDVPSGWHVEEGPTSEGAIQPDVLVSLTAPKKGCLGFKVR